ncbi:hypothetical protein L484_000590 [Morus notabilis]|uniref:Uncharacterized protein n=1 Tax=Morus notabilis TaxID=981085 RepID=W9SDL0_9ROSA|nr:hypothetical protein L484_000590 [Morus notabilis]
MDKATEPGNDARDDKMAENGDGRCRRWCSKIRLTAVGEDQEAPQAFGVRVYTLSNQRLIFES